MNCAPVSLSHVVLAKSVGKVVPGRLPVVPVLQAKDEKVADELHGVAEEGDERDHLVDHRAPVRFHVGEVHAVIVVPELVGIEEKLKQCYSLLRIRAVSITVPKESQFRFLDCFWPFFWNRFQNRWSKES